MFNFNYAVSLVPAEEGGFVVTFPDVPEAITEGEDEGDALLRAVDALETALEFYTDGNEDLPKASKPKRGQGTVRPSALACVKLAIYQGMRDQGVRKSDLARRLNVHMPQVDRLLDLDHASRLDLAEGALKALGYQVQIGVSPVGAAATEATPSKTVRRAVITKVSGRDIMAMSKVSQVAMSKGAKSKSTRSTTPKTGYVARAAGGARK